MIRKILSILGRFPGRTFWLPLMAVTAVLEVLLFLVFPPVALTPINQAGGGGSAQAARSAAVTAQATRRVAVSTLASLPSKLFRIRYLTLNLGDTVVLSPGPVRFGEHPVLLSRIGLSSRYQASRPGHTVFTVGRGKAMHQVYLFVSPLAAREVTRTDLDWYKTQYGTGYANCGPAMVSMSLLWARGQDVPVEDIRQEIGYPYDDGAVSFDNIEDALARHGVKFTVPQLAGPEDLRRIIDHGHIAVVLVQSGDIGKVRGDPVDDLVGRYYDDDEGHYVLVKGYTLDGDFFIVYDPYPVDWDSNRLRYDDEATMIGKNRFYPADQMFDAMKTPFVIEVWSN
jgi:hypothetical protein